MRIGDVCKIHSGHTARGKLEPQSEGGTLAIQMGDVGSDGEIHSNLQRYDLGNLADHYFVSEGDVVFRSRGEVNTAVAIDDSLPEPAAVMVPLVVIRPDKKRILAEYLAWAINQPDAQRKLRAEAQGTNLRMIPKTVLEQLEVAVPDLPTQRRIIEIHTLARHEGRLLRQLAALRERLVSKTLGDAAKAAQKKEPTK